MSLATEAHNKNAKALWTNQDAFQPDVLQVIFGFQGDPYTFGCPADPCQDNSITACP